MPKGMTYIVQRKDRFYVVAYDGLDPLTGKERRRWHPVGHDRGDAELAAARIDRDNAGAAPARGGPVDLGQFLTDTWLPLKRRHVDGMTSDDIVRCVRRSNVLTCHEGDRLLKVGGSAHNVFVVLEGRLEVSRDGAPVGSIGPGEVVGEMAHLLRMPRGFDVDVTEPGARLLSLSNRTLAGLADDDPATSARLLSNISRQLCRRLAR